MWKGSADSFFVDTEDISCLDHLIFLTQGGFTESIVPTWAQLRTQQNKVFKFENILNSQHSQGFFQTDFKLPYTHCFPITVPLYIKCSAQDSPESEICPCYQDITI